MNTLKGPSAEQALREPNEYSVDECESRKHSPEWKIDLRAANLSARLYALDLLGDLAGNARLAAAVAGISNRGFARLVAGRDCLDIAQADAAIARLKKILKSSNDIGRFYL